MRPIHLVPVAADAPRTPAQRRTVAPATRSYVWQPVPSGWSERIEAIAAAMRKVGGPGVWHELGLRVCGELVKRGVEPEYVPAIVGAIAQALGTDARAADKRARSTIEREGHGGTIKGTGGYSWSVTDAIAEATATGAEAEVFQSRRATSVDLVAITRDMDQAIANAGDGVTLIVAACGLGKTQAAIRTAQARDEVDNDAKRNVKTSILVPTHALARQIHGHLPRSRRLFGALSAEGEDECKHKDWAKPFVEGGQSLHVNFCLGKGQRCEHFDGCKAREGAEGMEDARITIAAHQKTSTVVGAAGVTELVVSDEPPPVLHRVVIKAEDWENAERCFDEFERPYLEDMIGAFRALRYWTGPDQPPHVDLSRVFGEDDRGRAPKLLYQSIRAAKYAPAPVRRALGNASRVFAAVYDFYTAPKRVARHEGSPEAPSIVLTFPDMAFVRLLRRPGRVVLLDANGLVNLPIYRQILEYEPHFRSFSAPDGAPIERTMLRTRQATRTAWLTFEHVATDPGSLVAALTTAVDYILERPSDQSIAFVSFSPVERLLRAAVGESTSGMTSAERQLAASVVAPILRRLGERKLLFGHYGGLRGLDTMAHCDTLVTLGDHRHNLDDVKATVEFLGTADEQSADQRSTDLCRAELEQAHGRLRTIHRTKPGRSLHVGSVLPSGHGWTDAESLALGASRSDDRAVYDLTELRTVIDALGGIRATAKACGCSTYPIVQARAGDAVLKASLWAKMRHLYVNLPVIIPYDTTSYVYIVGDDNTKLDAAPF